MTQRILLENLSRSGFVLTPIFTICPHSVETCIRYSTTRDCGFIGLKNKSCSKNTLSQLLYGSGFILVEEAFINQRTAVYFSFRGKEKSKKSNIRNKERK